MYSKSLFAFKIKAFVFLVWKDISGLKRLLLKHDIGKTLPIALRFDRVKG